MKILHVIDTLDMGGAENFLSELVPIQASMGHKVVVLELVAASNMIITEKLKNKGILVISLSSKRTVRNPINILALIPYLRKYDIVHVHLFPANYWVALAKLISFCHTPIVTTEHSTDNKRRRIWIFKYIDSFIYKRYNAVIACSYKAKETFCQRYKGIECLSIPNGVDIGKFSNAIPYKKQELAGIPEDCFVSTMVARFIPSKRQDVIVRAMSILPNNHHAVLVGGQEHDDGVQKVKALVKEFGIEKRVHFLYQRSDVPKILKSSDVVIMSSEYEGLSLSSIEGMACGHPFVASNVNGLREVVDGAGILVECGDAKGLADIILKLETDTVYRDEIVQKCKERISHYDIRTVAEKYIEVYKSFVILRVLVLTNNLSGLYNFRKEVIQALLDKGCAVTVSSPSDSRTCFFEGIGCEVIDTRFDRKGMNPLKDLRLMLFYTILLKKHKPDVVLSYTIKPNIYGGMACQLCNIPQVANITGLGSAVENPGWLQRLTILLYKVGLRKAETVFFQNRANMEFCETHQMVKGRRVLIPGSGVNLQYHAIQEYPTEHPLRFIFLGRLMRQKGIDKYLAAAEIIKAKYPETEFHIVGGCEEDYEGRIEELQKKRTIIYHGWQADVRPYIGMCHCTIHPSFYPEGMSNVLLESCAAGRPVITTDRPGCGEIVDDGINGFVIKPQDVKSLIEAIEMFIRLPYEQKKLMGLAARKKVEREFDRNIVVSAYLKELNSIVRNDNQ